MVNIGHNQGFGRLTPQGVAGTQRCLVMLKPDGLRYFRRAVLELSSSLSQRGVLHRFVLPTVSGISREVADRFWTDPAPQFERHRRFMTASHEDPRVISAPSLAIMVEGVSQDGALVDTLRRFDVIGPTNVERMLVETPFASDKIDRQEKERAAEEKKSAFISRYGTADFESVITQSLRFKLTFGDGGRMWPFPRAAEDPMYNRVHCSDSQENALVETGLLFSPLRSVLGLQYDPQAADLICSFWNNMPIHDGGSGSVVLPLYPDRGSLEERLGTVFGVKGYKDFGPSDRMDLAYDASEVLPVLAELSRDFVSGIGGSAGSKTIVDLGAEKGPQNIPLIIAVCGDMGSGKTTLKDLIEQNGFVELAQTTNRPPRGAEKDGVDYDFVSTDQLIDLLGQGRMAGVDRVGDTFWAVPSSFMHPARLDTKGLRYVIACGPNTAASMKEQLGGVANVISVFLNCSSETLAKRLLNRGTDSPEELERRKAHIADTERRFAPRLAEFDLVIDANMLDPQGCLAEVLRHTALVEGNKVEPKRCDASSFKMGTSKRLVQFLFDGVLLRAERDKRGLIGDLPFDEIFKSVEEHIGPHLKLFMEELYRSYNKKGYLTNRDNAVVLTNLTKHILLDYAVSRQIFSGIANIKASDARLGQLRSCGDEARMERNIQRAYDVTSRIPEDERAAIVFLHDIGKVARFSGHPAFSASIIDDYDLLQNSGLNDRQKNMIRLLIKYHQNVGDWAYSFLCWDTVLDMFRDPEAQNLFRNNDGSVDIQSVRDFLDRTEFFTVCDVAGPTSPKGGLRNTNLELYCSLIDAFNGVFSENTGNYDSAIEALESDRSWPEKQLGSMLAAFNTTTDSSGKPLEHYWGLIRKAAERAAASGIIEWKDWESFIRDSNSIDNKYCPHFWWMRFGQNPEKPAQYDYYVRHEAESPPESLINNYAIISRLLHQTIPDFGRSKRVVLEHYDGNGGELAGRQKEMDGAWVLHDAFQKVRGYVLDGNDISFVDASGIVLESVKAEVIPGDPFYTLKFVYPGLTYDPNNEIAF